MLNIDTCLQRTRYAQKDARKAALATKYIGRGSPRSSTNAYRLAIGPQFANTGNYAPGDTVWISAEGARANRLNPDFREIGMAIDALTTIITDGPTDRQRPYNVGERQVGTYLTTRGYVEVSPGRWQPQAGL